MPAEAATAAATTPSTSGASASRASVAVAVEDGAHGEDRAAEVAEDDDAVAGLGGVDRGAHAGAVGAEPAVHVAARRLDPHVRPGHLARQRGRARRYVAAMRDDDDPDHGSESKVSKPIRQCRILNNS